MDYQDQVPKSVRMHSDGLPPNYPNAWIPILESTELGRGQVKSVIILGKELVAVRGANGQVYVTDAYCPHLGANLAVGGQVVSHCKQDCIRCPFHGWTFRMHDGQCVHVPYEKDSLPNAKLKLWRSIEVNNLIFVWYHADNQEPTWGLEEMSEISNQTWKLRGRTEHTVNCHFQEIFENVADLVHFETIHFGKFPVPLNKILKSEYSTIQWSACPSPNDYMTKFEVVTQFKLFGFTLFAFNIKGIQMGPTYSEIRFEIGFIKGTFLQHVKPVGPMQTSIVFQIYIDNTVTGYLLSKLFLFLVAFEFEQDMPIWNRKTYLKKPLFSKSDKSLVKFRRWITQFYSENSAKTLDW